MKVSVFKSAMQFCHFIALFLFFVESSAGQIWLDTKTDSLIRSGIELSIQHDYSQAESIFQQLIADSPDHPIGYFFMAATLQAKMMDYESEQWSQDFHRYIRLAINAAESQSAARPEQDLWSRFYHGSALCYLAFYEGRKGNYLKAISHGLAGVSILKEIIKLEPEFYDAYFGIGSYKYWRSQAMRHLNWLPLISDDRNAGLQMVQQAVEQSQHTRPAAMNELIWMLLDSNRPAEAYAWATRGLEQFPRSRFFLWGAAKSALTLERYPTAAAHFQQLLQSLLSAPVNNHYNEFLCRVHLAHCLMEIGEYAAASAQIDTLESLPLDPGIEKRLKKHQELASRLKKRLSTFAATNFWLKESIAKEQFADKQRRHHTRQVTE